MNVGKPPPGGFSLSGLKHNYAFGQMTKIDYQKNCPSYGTKNVFGPTKIRKGDYKRPTAKQRKRLVALAVELDKPLDRFPSTQKQALALIRTWEKLL